MWWSNIPVKPARTRRQSLGAVALLLGLALLGPAGCGFTPMYAKGGGDKGGVSVDLAAVRIGPIKDRLGQQLRNALVQRLTPQGEPGDYRYTLLVQLTESASDLGYRRDSFATLGNLTMVATIGLQGDGVGILAGTATTVVSFDYLGPRYASVATERDAEDRAVTQLADDIRSQVAAALIHYKAHPNDARYRKIDAFEFVDPSRRPVGSGSPPGLR